ARGPEGGRECAPAEIERGLEQLLDVARVGIRIEVESFPPQGAQDGDPPVGLGDAHPESDQKAGSGHVQRRRRGGLLQALEARVVEIADVERVAGRERDDAEGGRRDSRCPCHGRHPPPQSPRLMVKKKLRLGGYGVTSIFRAIGWLPKLLTSGSNPLYGVATQKRFRALTDSWAVRT